MYAENLRRITSASWKLTRRCFPEKRRRKMKIFSKEKFFEVEGREDYDWIVEAGIPEKKTMDNDV